MPQAENIVSMDRYRRAPVNSGQFSRREKTLTEIRCELAQRVRPSPPHDGTLAGAAAVQQWLIETFAIYNEVLA